MKEYFNDTKKLLLTSVQFLDDILVPQLANAELYLSLIDLRPTRRQYPFGSLIINILSDGVELVDDQGNDVLTLAATKNNKELCQFLIDHEIGDVRKAWREKNSLFESLKSLFDSQYSAKSNEVFLLLKRYIPKSLKCKCCKCF